MASSTERRTPTINPPPDRPYRTYLRAVDPAQLQALSLADGRADDPYRPYEEERTLIAEWQDKDKEPPASLLTRWAMHPDERVRAELVRSSKTFSWIDTTGYPSRFFAWESWTETFSKRIITEMRSERVWWTPLFDAMVCAHWIVHSPVASMAVANLTPWFETRATPNDVRDILHAFREPTIIMLVLRHAGCIDKQLAREIYKLAPDHYSIAALAKNPALSPDVVAALAEWLVEDWEARIRNESATQSNSWYGVVSLLWRHPSSVPPNILRRIYALPKLARDLGVRMIDAYEYRSESSNQRNLSTPEIALYEVVLFSEEIATMSLSVPPDVIRAAVPFVQREKKKLLTLLRHPNADVTAWREALHRTQIREVYEHAARDSKLRRDPEILACLLRSKRPDVLVLLAEDADPQIAADAVRHLIACDHSKRAAQVLAARSIENPIALNPGDLTPLLQSDDPSIRLAAITSLGKLQEPTTTPKQPLCSVKAQRKKP